MLGIATGVTRQQRDVFPVYRCESVHRESRENLRSTVDDNDDDSININFVHLLITINIMCVPLTLNNFVLFNGDFFHGSF